MPLGQFLLTGSSDVLHLPRIHASLAGRARLITLRLIRSD